MMMSVGNGGSDADQRHRDRRGGEAAEHQRALAADHDEADARRDRHRERGEDQRRGALQRVLEREGGAEAAAPDIGDEVDRRLADREQKQREQQRRDDQREQRNRDIFGIRPQPPRESPIVVRRRAGEARSCAAAVAPSGIDSPSRVMAVRRRRRRVRGECVAPPRHDAARRDGHRRSISGDRADDAFEQIIHLVEERIEIVVGLVDHDLAGLVVLQRPDIDRLPWPSGPRSPRSPPSCRLRVAPAPNGVFCTIVALVAAGGEIRQACRPWRGRPRSPCRSSPTCIPRR